MSGPDVNRGGVAEMRGKYGAEDRNLADPSWKNARK